MVARNCKIIQLLSMALWLVSSLCFDLSHGNNGSWFSRSMTTRLPLAYALFKDIGLGDF